MAESPYVPDYNKPGADTNPPHSMGRPVTSQRIVPASHVVVRRTRGIEVFVSQDNFEDEDMSTGYTYKFNDSNMEDAFQVFYFGGFHSMRVAALLSSILALMIVVYSIGSEDPPAVTILWLLFCVQLCLFLMLLLVASVKMLLRLLRTAIVSLALTTSITVSLAHVISIKTLPNAHPSTLGLLLLGLLTVVRPRFLTSTISMVLGLISYIIISLAMPAPGWGALDWGSRVVELLMIISVGLALLALSETYSRRMFLNGLELERQNHEAEKERKRTETLLENVLPQELVSRVMAGQKLGSLLHVYPQGTVVQSDICNFTVLSDRLPAACVIGLLDLLFTQFDAVCKKFNVEKIKTVGDAYIAADFLHNRHLERIIDTALCFVSVAKELADDPTVVELTGGSKLSIRVGIGSGSILADVIGYDKCVYDVFGEAPDEAAIMESTAEPMLVHCTSSQMEKLIDKYIIVQHSGKYYIEGKKNLINSGWEEDIRQPIVHSHKGTDDALCPDPLTFIFSKSDPSLQIPSDDTQPELRKWTLMFKDPSVERQAINYLSAVSSKHSLHLVGLGAWVYFIFPLPTLMLFPKKVFDPALIVAYVSYCLFGAQAIIVAFVVGLRYSRNKVDESGVFSPHKLRQQSKQEETSKFRLSLTVLILGFICSATSIILIIATFDHAHSGAMVSFPIATTLMYFFSNYHLLYWIKMIFGVTYFFVLCIVYMIRKDVARSPAADLVTFLATFLLSMLAARHLEFAYRRFFLSHRTSVQKGVEIQRTQQWGELLLESMIPSSVVHRLRNNILTADEEFATCMFVSIHGASGPELNIVLYHLDAILVDCYSVEKIKSRPYLVASGIPEQCPDHASRLVELAFLFHKCSKELKVKYGIEVSLCIGLNSGTISAGLVGDQKWIYDIFGDTVNTASRLTGVCEEGKTTISETTRDLLGQDYYIQDRNMIDIKGKGYMHCYYVSPETTNQELKTVLHPPQATRAPVVVMDTNIIQQFGDITY